MAYNPSLIKLLYEKLADVVGDSLDHSGFLIMSEYIEKETGILISQTYLYDTYRSIEKAIKGGNKPVRMYTQKLDTIAKAIGYSRFSEFLKGHLVEINPILKGCEGNWWHFIRAYSGEYIVKAPVKISHEENRMKIELKGRELFYKGSIELRSGNLFCNLDTGNHKILFIVLKIGTIRNPILMQGTFAGISSATNPVGGKLILLRENKLEFSNMNWEKMELGTAKIDRRILRYFKTYESNCLTIEKVNTCDFGDIE